MATVEIMSVRRTVLPSSPRTSRLKKTAMTIRPESGGTTLNIPYAPKNPSHSNLTADYVVTPRPGLQENVTYTNLMRPRMNLDLDVYDKTVTTTTGATTTQVRAISVIQALQNMAKTGKRVRIAYGKLESGLWYITKMDVKSERRDPLTDEMSGATVSLECIRGDSSFSGTGTGPVSGGAIQGFRSLDPTPVSVARTYTTKAGETIWSIAIKFYGSSIGAPDIAAANNITDLRRIKPGTTLRIPA